RARAGWPTAYWRPRSSVGREQVRRLEASLLSDAIRQPPEVLTSNRLARASFWQRAPVSTRAEAAPRLTVIRPTLSVGSRTEARKIWIPRSQERPSWVKRATSDGASTFSQTVLASWVETACTNSSTVACSWAESLEPHPARPRASAAVRTPPKARIRGRLPCGHGTRAASRRPRPSHRRPPRVGHRPVQLPLPILHAGGGIAMAGAGGCAVVRGDHTARVGPVVDGRA